nr:DNA-binding WRKY [Tanacetum cinerariifolium]
MFSFVSHTNLRPSHEQTETNITSTKNYFLDMNNDQACEFTFEDIFDNYKQLTDNQPSYKDSTHSDFAAHLGVFEQNHVFQENMIADDQVCSLIDFATHNSTNEHNSVMHKSITNGSTSKRSTTNVSFTDGSTSKSRHEIKTQMLHTGLKLALRMKTKLDVVDDGYKWKKYGKKQLKSSPYP